MPVTINGSNTPTAGGVTYGDGTQYATTSAGTSGQVLTSAGSSAPTWTTPSAGALTLLATLTPTTAANVDALTAFTSSYDNYVIIIDGINAASGTADQPYMRFANGGTVDTTGVYRSAYYGASDQNTNATFLDLCCTVGQVNVTNGRGYSAVINIWNANATNSTYKSGSVQAVWNDGSATGTNYFQPCTGYLAYRNTSAISGVRFYWVSGANFAAQGKIRIYGYSNS